MADYQQDNHFNDNDLIKLKELLQHTSEFIAYLEHAETKMIAWQHNLERQTQVNNTMINQQLETLHNELVPLQDAVKQTGFTRLTMSMELALKEGEVHLTLLQKTCEQLMMSIKNQQCDYSVFLNKGMAQIEQQTTMAIKKITKELAQYDVNHFHEIATNSCEQVEQFTTSNLQKNTTLLQTFQRRTVALVLSTTFITSIAIGLYVSNELPWEIHQHAMNEREAGRTLIKIWPVLTQDEKNKILNTNKKNLNSLNDNS